jgi:hypothetical protein
MKLLSRNRHSAFSAPLSASDDSGNRHAVQGQELNADRCGLNAPCRVFRLKACGAVAAGMLTFVSFLAVAQPGPPSREAVLARAKALELKTPYVAPPGDPAVHHASGYAKIVCSAVFISGFDAEFAAENLGYFVAPYAERKRLGKPQVDRGAKEVHIGRSGVRDVASRQTVGLLQAGEDRAPSPECRRSVAAG